MAEDLIIQVQIDSRPAQAGRDQVIRTLQEIKAAVETNAIAMGVMGKTGVDAFEQIRAAAERQMATLAGNRREYDLLQASLQGVSAKQLDYVRGIHSATDAIRLEQKAIKDLNEEKSKQQSIQETRDMHMQNQRWADETGKTTGGVMPLIAPPGQQPSAFATLGMLDPNEQKLQMANLKAAMAEINVLHREGAISLSQHEQATKNFGKELNRLGGIANTVERSALRRLAAATASLTFEMGGAVAGTAALGAMLGAPLLIGMKHLKHMEEIALSMRAIIRSITALSEDEAKAATQNMTAQLQEQAVKFNLSLDDLAAAARVALAPGINADMGFDEIVRIATLATSAVKHFGLNSQQVIQETRALMTGSGNAASATLRTAMNITKEEMKAAKESAGGVIGFLENRMKGFMETAPEMALTMSGLLDGLGIKMTRLFADPKMFEDIKATIKGLSDAIGEVKDGKFIFTPEAITLAKEFLDTVRFIGDGLIGLIKTAFNFREELLLGAQAWLVFKAGSAAIPLMVTGFGNLVEISKAIVAIPMALKAVSAGEGITSALSSIENFKSKAVGLSAGAKGGIIGLVLFGVYELLHYTGIIDGIFNKFDARVTSTIEASKAARARGADATTQAQGGPNAIERRNLQQLIGDATLEAAGLMRLLSTIKSTGPDAETGYVQGDIERSRLAKLEKTRLTLQEELDKQNKVSGVKETGALEVLMEARLRAFARFDEILSSKVSTSIQKATARKERAEIETNYNFAVDLIKKGQKPVGSARFAGDGDDVVSAIMRESEATGVPIGFSEAATSRQLGGRDRGMNAPASAAEISEYKEWLQTSKEVTKETAAQEKQFVSLQKQVEITAGAYAKSMGDANDLVANITSKTLKTLEDGLVNVFMGGKFEAKEFFREIMAMIARLIVQQTLIKPITAALTGESGTNGWLSALFGLGSAAVGAYAGSGGATLSDGSGGSNYFGGIQARASGGAVQGGRSYLVGEQGPEMFTSGNGGYITPNNALQAPKTQSTSVYAPVLHYSPTIDARGSDAGVQQRIEVAMAKAKAEAFKMVQSSFERGGAMHKAVR